MNLQEQVGDYLLLKRLKSSVHHASYLAYQTSENMSGLHITRSNNGSDERLCEVCYPRDDISNVHSQELRKHWEQIVSLKHKHLPQWISLSNQGEVVQESSHPILAYALTSGIDLTALLDKGKRRGKLIPLPHGLFICQIILQSTLELIESGWAHNELTADHILISYQGHIEIRGFEHLFGPLTQTPIAKTPSVIGNACLLMYQLLCQQSRLQLNQLDAITVNQVTSAQKSVDRLKTPPSVKSWLYRVLSVLEALSQGRTDHNESIKTLSDSLDTLVRESGLDATEEMLAIYVGSLYHFE